MSNFGSYYEAVKILEELQALAIKNKDYNNARVLRQAIDVLIDAELAEESEYSDYLNAKLEHEACRLESCFASSDDLKDSEI